VVPAGTHLPGPAVLQVTGLVALGAQAAVERRGGLKEGVLNEILVMHKQGE